MASPGAYHFVERALTGRPLATGRMRRTLLPKRLALPIFSSDALSSVAYPTEATLVVLLAASASARSLVIPISVAIGALLAVVVFSYQQTVRAYPNGGGAYVVAKENPGREGPGLVAAAALRVDRVLTVAVRLQRACWQLRRSRVPHRYTLELSFLFWR